MNAASNKDLSTRRSKTKEITVRYPQQCHMSTNRPPMSAVSGGAGGLLFSSRRRHTRYWRDWSSDVCSSDLRTYSHIIGGSLERKMPMPEQQVDQQRIRYGLWIILTGFALVALITVVSIFKWDDVTSVATAIGATTSLVGTVVGSFLGVQVGSAGKERVETDRQRLEDTVRLALSMLPPEIAKQLQQEMKR